MTIRVNNDQLTSKSRAIGTNNFGRRRRWLFTERNIDHIFEHLSPRSNYIQICFWSSTSLLKIKNLCTTCMSMSSISKSYTILISFHIWRIYVSLSVCSSSMLFVQLNLNSKSVSVRSSANGIKEMWQKNLEYYGEIRIRSGGPLRG